MQSRAGEILACLFPWLSLWVIAISHPLIHYGCCGSGCSGCTAHTLCPSSQDTLEIKLQEGCAVATAALASLLGSSCSSPSGTALPGAGQLAEYGNIGKTRYELQSVTDPRLWALPKASPHRTASVFEGSFIATGLPIAETAKLIFRESYRIQKIL